MRVDLHINWVVRMGRVWERSPNVESFEAWLSGSTYNLVGYEFFFNVRSSFAEILIFLVVPSSSVTRTVLRFGKKRRLVLFFACETLFPLIGPLPLIAHFLAIGNSLRIFKLRIVSS